MADFTLGPTLFPVGTTVGVYDRKILIREQGGPVGAQITSGVVGSDQKVTFTGLAYSADFHAAASVGGTWQKVAFSTAVDPNTASATLADVVLKQDAATAATDAELAVERARSDALESDSVDPAAAVRKWFPVPTGGDDATELISRLAAGEKDIALRRLTYAWNQTLGTIPAAASIQGAGKALTVINKGFSGTLATLADGAQLRDLKIDGKGATRTGKGFLFAGTDGRQSLSQVVMVDMDDLCLDFATAAGSQSEFIGCKLARYNGIARDVYSVKIDPAQQLAAIPRKFIACETDGTPFIDIGGCNDLHLMQGYWGKLKFGVESRGVVAFGRFGGDYASESPASTASTTSGSATITSVTPTTGWVNGMHVTGSGIPADTIILSGAGTATMVLSNACTATAAGVAVASSVLYVRGFNHDLKGDFAPQPVIGDHLSAAAVNYSSITIEGTHNNAPVIDLSNFRYRNLIGSPLIAYTPALTSDAVAPTLGDGTVVGYWSRSGSTIHVSIVLTRGSTTSFGTGTLQISLPVTPTGGTDQTLHGMALDVSVAGNMHYLLGGVISPGVGYVTLRADGLAFGVGELNAPGGIAWATGDIIRVSGSYEL